MQPGLDILLDHGNGNQRVAEDETHEPATVVRAPGRIRGRVELDPLRVVDGVEERETMRADLGPDRGLEGGAVGNVEERGEVDGGDEGVEAGEDGGVGSCGGGCQAGGGRVFGGDAMWQGNVSYWG